MGHDLISREALKKAVRESYHNNPHPLSRDQHMHRHEHNHMIEMIEAAPAADSFEPPCRIGDEVWGLKIYRERLLPKKGVVHQMYYGDDMQLCICVKGVCRGQWGKNVFSTEEEAYGAAERGETDGK